MDSQPLLEMRSSCAARVIHLPIRRYYLFRTTGRDGAPISQSMQFSPAIWCGHWAYEYRLE
jgi:hypothetical protein